MYNLQNIFDKINKDFFESKLSTQIIWARSAKAKASRYRRLGCYMPRLNLIKINPILDDLEVPDYFIEYIVYHEMLHAVCPPIKGIGRRRVHHKKFLEREKLFPSFEQAKAWEITEGRKKFF